MPVPDLSLSQFTTLPFPLTDDIALCNRIPVRSIELCEAKLSPVPEVAHEQLEALRLYGIVPVSFQSRVHSLFPDSMAPTPTDPAQRVEAMCRSMDRLARVFPITGLPCVVIGGVAPQGDVHGAERVARTLLPRLCDHAQGLGFHLAYEAIHPLLVNTDTFTWNLADAARLVHEVDREELGLVVDTWHISWEAGLADRLRELAPRVFIVHLSDHPRTGARHFMDRCVLGTGCADLPLILRALHQGGYRGPYCLEILSDLSLPDSLWKWPPEALMRVNMRAFREVWRAAMAET